MRQTLLACFLSLIAFATYAQTDRFAYVITDVTKEGVNWNSLRKIDLQTNTYGDILLNGSDVSQLAFDADTKRQFVSPLTDAQYGIAANAAFGTGVAAIAYDKKNSRLYYTPMLIDQLRYVDLKTMKVYFVNKSENKALKVKAQDQSNIITRMAIASDGNGYALTNDGNHLIRFTTGKKTIVTDLGALTNDPANKTVSFHDAASFGGDMIADDDGNLYVFSARKHVFRINLDSRIASYLGSVAGLPENFSVNAAVVTSNNQILLASATNNKAMFTVDHESWNAVAISSAEPWRSSDMANSNLLATRIPKAIPGLMQPATGDDEKRMAVFPNPVVDKRFNVQFNQPKGKYTILVTDALGRQKIRSAINVLDKGQVENVTLPATTKKGVYVVKVVDQESKTVFSRKIVVQ